MGRLAKRENFLREATDVLKAMRVVLSEIRAASAIAVGASPKTVATSRVEETIARLASLPRTNTAAMMRMPAELLRVACERIVSPGCIRQEVFSWLIANGYPARKSSFYQFANRFTAMYRQVQAEQLSPAAVERPSKGV